MIEAVVCTPVQVFGGHRFSLLVGQLSGSGIVGSHGVRVLFYRKLPSFSTVSVLFDTCTNNQREFPFCILPALGIVSLANFIVHQFKREEFFCPQEQESTLMTEK